uniref:Uncharacterized protein n=1 Tax=Lates calcarifer TaxID=8187 RepID=A0A4W6D7Q1_LATCA
TFYPHTYTHSSTSRFVLTHTHTNTNFSASSLYPPSPFLSQMCPHPKRESPSPQNNKIKSCRLTLRHPPAPF